jgi:phosphate transport system substrate-binding protein
MSAGPGTPQSTTPTTDAAAPTSTLPPIVRRKKGGTTTYLAILVVVVIVLVVAGAYADGLIFKKAAKASPPGACPTGVTLLGAGASLINPIMSVWAPAYQSATGNQVSYNPSGAGAGITSLQDQQVDFAATDNPINSSTQSSFKAPVETLPISGGAVAIDYNVPSATAPIQLSGPVLADIYLGVITSWNDPRITANNTGLSLPDDPIYPTIRSDSAGTTYVLTNYLSEDSPKWNTTVGQGISVAFPKIANEQAQKGNSGVLNYVLKTEYSIGYVDLTDSINAHAHYASLLNPSGDYLAPTLTDTASAISDIAAKTTFPSPTGNWNSVSFVNSPVAGDYPLATLSYGFVYVDDSHGDQGSVARAQVIEQFLNWTITTGQSYAAANYYVPLIPTLVTLDESGLKALTFNGAALPACG